MEALRYRVRHLTGDWAYFEELRVGTGYGKGVEQRLDAWAMSLWPSTQLTRVTYEVKISRGDFRREMRSPLKRRVGLLYSNLFYFVAPAGLLKVEEIPPECGLIEVEPANPLLMHGPTHVCKVTVEAPRRDTPPPGWMFFAAVARRAMREGV